jgi:hypothetical protein
LGIIVKIVVDISEGVSDGMWSAGRGESRWAQNVATALAHMGATVYCLCAGRPKWGKCPPINNMELVPLNRRFAVDGPGEVRRNVDLYIDACWWDKKPSPEWISARAYWHVHYGRENRLKDASTIKANHYIVYPYKQGASVFLAESNPFRDRTLFCPIPCFKDHPGASKFGNKGLVWTGKDAFLDRFMGSQEYILIDASNMIDVLVEISAKRSDIPISFLMAQQLTGRDKDAQVAIKKYDVIRRLESIPNRKMYDLLDYNSVMRIIGAAQIVSPPHSCGSHLEAVSLGVVPIIKEGFIYDEAARSTNSLFPHSNADKKELISHIEHLMRDQNYYNLCLQAYQEAMKEHSEIYVQNVVSSFIGSLK